jgi:hypothetical protein
VAELLRKGNSAELAGHERVNQEQRSQYVRHKKQVNCVPAVHRAKSSKGAIVRMEPTPVLLVQQQFGLVPSSLSSAQNQLQTPNFDCRHSTHSDGWTASSSDSGRATAEVPTRNADTPPTSSPFTGGKRGYRKFIPTATRSTHHNQNTCPHGLPFCPVCRAEDELQRIFRTPKRWWKFWGSWKYRCF